MRARTAWIAITLGACSSAPPRATEHGSSIPSAPPDAALAAVDAAAVVPDAPPAAAFVEPMPQVIAAATPASKTCVNDVYAYEHARELAALDGALRTAHGFLLETHLAPPAYGGRPAPALGSMERDRLGRLSMVVGSVGCGQTPRIYAIDEAGAVFMPVPVVKSAKQRHVTTCHNVCGGCGANLPPQPVLAYVPDTATWDGKERTITVPIDVQVTIQPAKEICYPPP